MKVYECGGRKKERHSIIFWLRLSFSNPVPWRCFKLHRWFCFSSRGTISSLLPPSLWTIYFLPRVFPIYFFAALPPADYACVCLPYLLRLKCDKNTGGTQVETVSTLSWGESFSLRVGLRYGKEAGGLYLDYFSSSPCHGFEGIFLGSSLWEHGGVLGEKVHEKIGIPL